MIFERIRIEKPNMVPMIWDMREDPFMAARPLPPRPRRVKQFILDAPRLVVSNSSRFSNHAILLLAR